MENIKDMFEIMTDIQSLHIKKKSKIPTKILLAKTASSFLTHYFLAGPDKIPPTIQSL